jgi:hypothetical protein
MVKSPKKSSSRAARVGLIIPPSKVGVKAHQYFNRVSDRSTFLIAAALECILEHIIEQSGEAMAAIEKSKKRVMMLHLQRALAGDPDLSAFTGKFCTVRSVSTGNRREIGASQLPNCATRRRGRKA